MRSAHRSMRSEVRKAQRALERDLAFGPSETGILIGERL